MAKQIKITIFNDNGIVKFDPQTAQAEAGDQIFWSNTDDKPHWPSLDDVDGKSGTAEENKNYFMTNQIAPNDVSSIFSPAIKSTIKYSCSLTAPSDQEPGQIDVTGEVS